MSFLLSGSQQSAIPDSEVLRWPFDEGGGTTATDQWGSNDGTITGATHTTDAAVGDYALSGDGTDDNVQGSSTGVTQTHTFSYSLWTRTGSIQIDSLALGESNNGDSPFILIYPCDSDVSGAVRVAYSYASNNNTMSGGGDLSDGAYHHIVVVERASDSRELYVDGSSVDTNTESLPTFSATNFWALGESGFGQHFSGEVDDLRVYDKALSDTEVSNLYNTGSIDG